MTTRIGFLRAVNLGKRRVDMKKLAAVTEGLGYAEVWTYINSGNVVFDASGPRAAIEKRAEAAFETAFGFECTTFVRSAAELRSIAAEMPFRLAGGDTHFVTFLKSAPKAGQATALEALSNDYDTIIVRGRDVHWRMHGLSSASTLKKKDWEQILGPNSSTSRNMTMVNKLVGKLDA